MRAIGVAVGLGALVLGGSARADDCFDASDRARGLLAKRHLVEARQALRVCAASACEEGIRTVCDERLGEVAARLPTIIFDVKDTSGRDLTGVLVAIDDGPSSPERVGVELSLDPGPHAFVFQAPDAPASTRTFVLVEREKQRREHIVLGELPPPASSPPPALPPPAPPPSMTEAASPWRTAAWVAVGAGAVGVGIGSAFGIDAIVKNDAAGCDANDVCDDPRSRSDARTSATVSTVSILIGGALAIAGGITLLLLPARPTTTSARAPFVVRW